MVAGDGEVQGTGHGIDLMQGEEAKRTTVEAALPLFLQRCPDLCGEEEAKEALGKCFREDLTIDMHIDETFEYIVQSKFGSGEGEAPAAEGAAGAEGQAEQGGAQPIVDDEEAAFEQETANLRRAMAVSQFIKPESKPISAWGVCEFQTKFPNSTVLQMAESHTGALSLLCSPAPRTLLHRLLTNESQCRQWYRSEPGVEGYLGKMASDVLQACIGALAPATASGADTSAADTHAPVASHPESSDQNRSTRSSSALAPARSISKRAPQKPQRRGRGSARRVPGVHEPGIRGPPGYPLSPVPESALNTDCRSGASQGQVRGRQDAGMSPADSAGACSQEAGSGPPPGVNSQLFEHAMALARRSKQVSEAAKQSSRKGRRNARAGGRRGGRAGGRSQSQTPVASGDTSGEVNNSQGSQSMGRRNMVPPRTVRLSQLASQASGSEQKEKDNEVQTEVAAKGTSKCERRTSESEEGYVNVFREGVAEKVLEVLKRLTEHFEQKVVAVAGRSSAEERLAAFLPFRPEPDDGDELLVSNTSARDSKVIDVIELD